MYILYAKLICDCKKSWKIPFLRAWGFLTTSSKFEHPRTVTVIALGFILNDDAVIRYGHLSRTFMIVSYCHFLATYSKKTM